MKRGPQVAYADYAQLRPFSCHSSSRFSLLDNPLIYTLIARFMGPIWGPYGADRTQVAPCSPHELCYLGSSILSLHKFLIWVPCYCNLLSQCKNNFLVWFQQLFERSDIISNCFFLLLSVRYSAYPMKGVLLCFHYLWFYNKFVVDSYDIFTHILQGSFP